MSKVTQRKKLSKGTWLLIIAVLVAIIVAVVLHFTYHAVGFGIDLGFLGGIGQGLMNWGALGGWNSLIIGVAFFGLGALFLYTLKAYFIGETVTTGAVGGTGYNPAPVYPTSPQKEDTETTIS